MLGDLSARYESNGDVGAISDNELDWGGKSYGCYQFSSRAGTVERFIQYLKDTSVSISGENSVTLSDENGVTLSDEARMITRNIGHCLGTECIGSLAFDDVWRTYAHQYKDLFFRLQHGFIKKEYYDVAVDLLRRDLFYMERHTDVLADVVWSRSVHYGPYWIVDLFQEALAFMPMTVPNMYPNLSYVDHIRFDWDLIDAVYTVCSSYEWNHGPYCESLNERFRWERYDALLALDGEYKERNIW